MPAYDLRPVTDASVLACLQQLPALPQPHWSWPFDHRLYSQAALMVETIRILGAGALSGNLGTFRDFSTWHASMATLVARMKAASVSELALTVGTWGGFDGDPTLAENTRAGVDYLTRFRGELEQIKDALERQGDVEGWPVRVVCVWIDQEQFKRKPDDPEHNLALKWCNDATLHVVRGVFGRDGLHVVQHGRGLSSYYNPEDERTGNHCCPLYNLDDVGGSLARYREACAVATREGVSAVYPVLSLGGHYHFDWHTQQGWRPDNFRANVAWRFGSWLNDVYFRAKQPDFQSFAHRVLFWPRVLPASCTVKRGNRLSNEPVPAYGAHFVAYVCGAARKQPAWIIEDDE